MKAAVIGASGNLGGFLTRKALQRGWQVTGYVVTDAPVAEGARVVRKSLFDLTREELKPYDVLLSAFGSGFDCDPAVNRRACDKLIELAENTGLHVLHIIGSGSLYETPAHERRVYEAPDHPDFLRGISREALLGLGDLRASAGVRWTVVCPSKNFDRDAAGTGRYRVGTDENLLYNARGESYVTYSDLADAMLDFARDGSHVGEVCTILTEF